MLTITDTHGNKYQYRYNERVTPTDRAIDFHACGLPAPGRKLFLVGFGIGEVRIALAEWSVRQARIDQDEDRAAELTAEKEHELREVALTIGSGI